MTVRRRHRTITAEDADRHRDLKSRPQRGSEGAHVGVSSHDGDNAAEAPKWHVVALLAIANGELRRFPDPSGASPPRAFEEPC